ncbi:aldehyde dehydrogenase family protein [Prauserella halophila]|uniref:Aldehyde dehydrogenase family protein n=1 Tax=Prauserella halophila TaxID=185641 RepID=A0ABP4H674_9PSEU|nr:aldehyde dehydrogenase family protein [Prauserella halophila]MCP2238143.1 aldehyde dehydrogenase (NAD+) [Prauserella halophila]
MSIEIETAPAQQTEWVPQQQFIAGIWRDGRSQRTLGLTNPYTQDALGSVQQASVDDLEEAYRAAAAAQANWSATAPMSRQDILFRAAEIFETRKQEIIDWLVAESGSTVLKAEVEVAAARAITVEAASYPYRAHGRILESNVPGKENRVYRGPLGVVGVISPWNFPLHLSQRSVAPALALGNAVVLKPASDTAITGGLLLAKIFEDAGLPAGVLNVVVGSGSEIGDAFVEHPVPALISFTGSTPVGQNVGRIAASGKHLKHVALELGGNSPFVVLADADLDQSVRAAAMGKFLHQGQICMAVNRIIVEDAIYDEFVRRFTDHVRTIKVGDPADPSTVVGPVINRSQRDTLLEKIRTARAEGAHAVLEGEVSGNVVPPHIFTDVTADMEIAREEIFGPLVSIQRVADEAEALSVANNTEFGLASAVFTGDLERGVAFARNIKAGMTHVNDIPVNDEAHVSFGGEGNSGLGRFNGEWAIDEFTTDHWISVQRTPRQYPF